MKKLFNILLINLIVLSSCQFRQEASPIDNLPKNIEIWNLFDESSVFEWQIQDFKSKNPWVTIVYKKFSDPKDYEQLIINEIAEWRCPDIFTLKNTWVEKHKWKLFPIEVWSTKIPMNSEIFSNTFLQIAVNNLTIDWKLYWVPLYIDTLALYYNKQILWDHFNSNKPENTWDKVSTQVERLSKNDNSVEWFQLAWIAMWWADNIVRSNDILYLLMLQYWAKFIDWTTWEVQFANSQWKIPWSGENNIPWKFALDFYTSFWKSSFKNFSWSERMTARYKESSEIYPFVQWKVAMIFGYSYLYEDLKNIISQFRSSNKDTILAKDIWIIEVPQIYPFSESSKRDSLGSYFPMVVSRNSKNPSLAWDFLIHLSSKQSLIDYNEKTNKPSSRIDLLDDQKLDPIYWVFARQASYSKSYPNFIADEDSYNIVFSQMIKNVVKSKEKSQNALISGQVIIQCIVDKYIKKEEMLWIDCFK